MTDRTFLNRRQLGFLALGGTIGAGLFISVGDGIRIAGSGLIAAYLIAASVAWVVSRCIGELALADERPRTFVAATFGQLGPSVALVQGWSYWATAVLACMAQLTAAGEFMHGLAPGLAPWLTALIALLALALVNRTSARTFGEAEFWLAALKISVLVGIMLWGATALCGLTAKHDMLAEWRWRPHGMPSLIAVLPLAFFAFGNSEIVGLAGAETKDAARVLPATINRFMARLVVLHVGVSGALLILLPPHAHGFVSPFEAVFASAGVPSAARIINVILIVVMISSCNACLFGAARAVDSLADIGCAPRRLAFRNDAGVPIAATSLTMAFVATAITFNAFMPKDLLGLVLAGASLLGLGNWAVIVVSHLRLVSRVGRRAGAARLPFARPMDAAALALIAAVVGGICTLSQFQPAAEIAAFWIVGLSGAAVVKRMLAVRSADGETAAEQ